MDQGGNIMPMSPGHLPGANTTGGVRGSSIPISQSANNPGGTNMIGGGQPQGLSHLEKLNMRLRARNSHAQQNNSMISPMAMGLNIPPGGAHMGMMPLPLSQRSFSPPQNQLGQQQQQQQPPQSSGYQIRNSLHGGIGQQPHNKVNNYQNFFVDNNNSGGSASPGLGENSQERLFSQNGSGIAKPLNARKIIVKRSRHIRDLSQDYTGGGNSQVGNPISNGGVIGGQMIQLPPMIKTPKEGRGAMDRNAHHFMMHTQNLPGQQLPITPGANNQNGGQQVIGGLRASYHQQMHQQMYNNAISSSRGEGSGSLSQQPSQNLNQNGPPPPLQNLIIASSEEGQNAGTSHSVNRYSNVHLQNPTLPMAGVHRTRQPQQLSSTSVKSATNQSQQLRSSQNQIRHEKSQSQQIPPSASGINQNLPMSSGGNLGPLNNQGNKLASAGGINFHNNPQLLNNKGLMMNSQANNAGGGIMTNNFLQQQSLQQRGAGGDFQNAPSIGNRGISPRRPRENMMLRNHGRGRENSVGGVNPGQSGASFFQQASASTMSSGMSLSSNQSSGSSSPGPSNHHHPVKQSSPVPASYDANANENSNVQFVDVQTLLFGENPIPLNPKTFQLKNHEVTKASNKKCGIVKAYAANTNQGIIREYNEDRVSIILNILKPKNKQWEGEWPQVCFFGVFDGHGGHVCAEYLRDNLHNFVIQSEHFPKDPREALIQGFKECENTFIGMVEANFQRQQLHQHHMMGEGAAGGVGPERSGTCANVVLIVNDMIYVANVGDSRAILSVDCGSQIAMLSRDHKPDDEQEKHRIQLAGGKIYRTQTFARPAMHPGEKDVYVQGPLRVFPGRLSVARTFGDIEAKRARFGGNQNVIICDPEIRCFKIEQNFDFILIGCDGIFDRLNNREIVNQVWESTLDLVKNPTHSRKNINAVGTSLLQSQQLAKGNNGGFLNALEQQANLNNNTSRKLGGGLESARGGPAGKQNGVGITVHQAVAEGVEMVLKQSAASRSLDNITVVILGFNNFENTVQKLNEGHSLKEIKEMNMQENKHRKFYDKFDDSQVIPEDFNFIQQQYINQSQGGSTKPMSSPSLNPQQQPGRSGINSRSQQQHQQHNNSPSSSSHTNISNLNAGGGIDGQGIKKTQPSPINSGKGEGGASQHTQSGATLMPPIHSGGTQAN